MKIIMEDKDYRDIIDTISDWYGITLNKKFIDRILKTNTRLYGEIYGGMDTGAREQFLDAVSEELIGESWPTGSNGKFEKFWKKISEAAIKRGLSVCKRGDE